jgi:Glycine cleavage system T protein (aminomethyltransferase)
MPIDTTLFVCNILLQDVCDILCSLVLFSQGRGFYIVTNGLSSYHTWAHIHYILSEKNFKVGLTDLSEKIGVLSIQGPKRCVRAIKLFLDMALLIQITNNVSLELWSFGI